MSPRNPSHNRVPPCNSVPTSTSSSSQRHIDDILSLFARSVSVDGGNSCYAAGAAGSVVASESPRRSPAEFASPTSSRRLAVRLLVGGVDSPQVPSPRLPSPLPRGSTGATGGSSLSRRRRRDCRSEGRRNARSTLTSQRQAFRQLDGSRRGIRATSLLLAFVAQSAAFPR
ncbi:hypothetical protein CLOM_g5334 [Closterium sp. NIES-68]|nr:hypothetical protein CLOM_g5334 [Closterium sp. NIES-68]